VKTATNKSIVLRVVTYGVENEPGDIDVSPSAYAALNTEEYPRTMTWEFAHCPDTGGVIYEFQTEANAWWTSLWVRNAALPLTKVEVKSTNHPEFYALRRETDGTLNDDGGFGEGPFTIRLTAMDGQTIAHDFPSFSPGELVETSEQFK
jgi:expansin (peptidoglycan-binding protein)